MRKLLVLTATLVAGVSMSGCWGLTQFSWSDAQPRKGDTVAGTIGLFPGSNGADPNSYFYIEFRGKGDGIGFKKARFDAAKVFGAPVKMVHDSALSAVVDDQGCALSPAPGGGPLFRTEDPVSSDTRRLTNATFNAKFSKTGGGGFGGFVTTGEWADDGDGVPEDPDTTDDEIGCTGATTTAIVTKAFATKTRSASLLDGFGG